MLLYFVTAWGTITGLVAYNECPSQALNWGLQKKKATCRLYPSTFKPYSLLL
jgi:hypothetical protein